MPYTYCTMISGYRSVDANACKRFRDATIVEIIEKKCGTCKFWRKSYLLDLDGNKTLFTSCEIFRTEYKEENDAPCNRYIVKPKKSKINILKKWWNDINFTDIK